MTATIAACLVPALTGLPVYFISDIPPGAVLFVSIGISWALVTAALLLLPVRRPHPLTPTTAGDRPSS